jgi:hypothetical protein
MLGIVRWKLVHLLLVLEFVHEPTVLLPTIAAVLGRWLAWRQLALVLLLIGNLLLWDVFPFRRWAGEAIAGGLVARTNHL